MPRPAERGLRPDARAQQDRRRADGTGRQGDAPPANLLGPARDVDVHADRPVLREENPVDETMRPDDEVGPVPGGQHVGERRRQTQAAPPVLRKRADAARFRVIVIGDLREAKAPADPEECILDRDQLIGPPAADSDRAAAPVQAAGVHRVVFQPTKMRQHLRPAPLVVPQRRPLVVIGRHPAKRDRGIDGRRPADHPAPRIGNGPARHGLRGQPPVMRTQRHPPGVLQIVRG